MGLIIIAPASSFPFMRFARSQSGSTGIINILNELYTKKGLFRDPFSVEYIGIKSDILSFRI